MWSSFKVFSDVTSWSTVTLLYIFRFRWLLDRKCGDAREPAGGATDGVGIIRFLLFIFVRLSLVLCWGPFITPGRSSKRRGKWVGF